MYTVLSLMNVRIHVYSILGGEIGMHTVLLLRARYIYTGLSLLEMYTVLSLLNVRIHVLSRLGGEVGMHTVLLLRARYIYTVV